MEGQHLMSTTVTNQQRTAPVSWEQFRVALQAQRADCLRERETALAEAATSMPDPVSVSRAARLLRTVEEIDAALERIADGTYGACVRCGRAIPAERLEFRPFAANCVACQDSAR
jgi:RNA polymerase-binding transcription factor DksA